MPGIVYCSTRKTVESVRDALASSGVRAARYHAGLSDEERRRSQDDFIYDRVSVMVATNAFGMGIDKSNVRYVIHYNMPGSIDSYYQEAGRAGRDGAPADCVLLFGGQDVATAKFLISKSEDDGARRAGMRKLRDMIAYCHADSCLRRNILRYFGERGGPENCGACGNCASVAERRDITVEAQKILSCVYRAAERTGGKSFAPPVISDILRGRSSSERRRETIISLGLDAISTWGIMSDASPREISDLTEFLAAEGFLAVGDYGGLSFTERTLPFLKKRERLLMRVHGAKPEKPARRGRAARLAPKLFPPVSPDAGENLNKHSGSRSAACRPPVEYDAGMFEFLRKLRAETAADEGVPPYVVFSDKTLIAMCASLPGDDEEFLAVQGVGEAKLKKYGKRFIGAIREWRESSEGEREEETAE
jgi:ATP-dependent DNA helicase RecQ